MVGKVAVTVPGIVVRNTGLVAVLAILMSRVNTMVSVWLVVVRAV